MNVLKFVKGGFLVLALMALSYSFVPHEYYVSICNLVYVESNRNLEIDIKFTAHDLEEDILSLTSKVIKLDKNEDGSVDELLQSFIPKYLKLASEEEQLTLSYIGYEFSLDEDCHVYFQVERMDKPEELFVTNELLTQTFKNQENIVNLTIAGQTNQQTFTKDITNHTFKINE